jgi:hypothetical protein
VTQYCPGSSRTFVCELLHETRETHRGWARPGADLVTISVALQLAMSLDVPLERASVQAFLLRCEDPVLGYLLQPDSRVTTIGTLAAGLEIADMVGAHPCFLSSVETQLSLVHRRDGGFVHAILPSPLCVTPRAASKPTAY